MLPPGNGKKQSKIKKAIDCVRKCKVKAKIIEHHSAPEPLGEVVNKFLDIIELYTLIKMREKRIEYLQNINFNFSLHPYIE